MAWKLIKQVTPEIAVYCDDDRKLLKIEELYYPHRSRVAEIKTKIVVEHENVEALSMAVGAGIEYLDH